MNLGMKHHLAILLVVASGFCLASCTPALKRPEAPDYALQYTVGGVSFDMVDIPSGHFSMGLSADNRRVVENGTVQEVALDGFVISAKPVNQALWTAVMGKNPSAKQNPELPVDFVSWNDVCKFIARLDKQTGKVFLLPTEAQWEYAGKTLRWSGFSILEEWCLDSYSAVAAGETRNDYFDPLKLMVNPQGPSESDLKLTRTVLTRASLDRHTRKFMLGFRLVQPTGDTLSTQLLEALDGTVRDREEVDASAGGAESFEVMGVPFKLVKVAGGTFEMGFTRYDTPHGGIREVPENEQPAHSVTVDDFAIGETEVTAGLWAAVMGTLPYLNDKDALQQPVGNVSWYDCQGFLRRLNALTGRKFRLPTEAEWEYAARGGRLSRHTPFSGSDNVSTVAVYSNTANGWEPRTSKEDVKRLRPNELGIYDMSGNVWEWCYDRAAAYSPGEVRNPSGAAEGGTRIMRGGSYASPWTACRVSNRSFIPAKNVKGSFGLRLAL